MDRLTGIGVFAMTVSCLINDVDYLNSVVNSHSKDFFGEIGSHGIICGVIGTIGIPIVLCFHYLNL